MEKNEKSDQILEYLQCSRICATDEVEEPPVFLRVGEAIIGTFGNFSASTGKAKSKKTFNVCAIAAAALRNGTVLNYTASLPEGRQKILYVDTEQSAYHCKRVLERILLMAGLPSNTHPENITFLSLRRFSPKDRLSIIEAAIDTSTGVGLIIIDGIRDLAYDINSPSEATNIITQMMRWSDERQLHIHMVLHLNKGDENTRGHLGTELNNKAETVILVEREDATGNSIVRPNLSRDVEFTPFALKINSEGLPELVGGYIPNNKASKKGIQFADILTEKHYEIVEKAFSDKTELTYSALIERLQETYLSAGYSYGINRTKELNLFLQGKNIIASVATDGKSSYRFNSPV
jgi:hypothetical protein